MTQDKIKLFIIERDSIYRLGLRTAIASYADLEIVGEGNINNDSWRELTQGLILNILVVGTSQATEESSLEFCRRITQLYPQLPIFLLLPTDFSPRKLAKVRALGIEGYCDRHSSINIIIDGLHCVARGNTYYNWQPDIKNRPQLWQTALSYLSKSGRLELAQEIKEINYRLADPNLSDWEKVFLVGRKRELSTVRWLSKRLVAEEITLDQSSQQTVKSSPGRLVPTASVELSPLPIFEDSANKIIFERVVTDVQIDLINRSQVTLEIDILKPEISKDLCYIILKRISETIIEDDLVNTLSRNYFDYLKAILTWSINRFFDRYYGKLNIEEIERLNNIINIEFTEVRENILEYIYGVPELFEYLLGKPGLTIDNVVYQSDDSEAIARIEFLLHNLIIHLANSAMLIILNNFYDLEIFKYKIYKSQYKSDRELARFRNQLSWKYRQERYFERPQNIFESRYRIFVINNGIRTSFVYAPRKDELEQLTGISWLTTMVIEVRDAIAPLVKKLVAFAGSGVVFILTQVIGKALGLVAKGIIQGIGSTIKDVDLKK